MLLLEAIFDPSPVFDVVNPDKPTGFWLLEEAAGFPLVLCAVDPSLVVDGPVEEVLAAKAAHPVRPLVAEEEMLVPVEFPETAAVVLTSVLLNARKVVGVSSLSLISGFFTNGSFTVGATETTAGAGF